MIEEREDEYDYIIFIRPDCLYVENLDIRFFDLINSKTIVIPNFHCYGKYKINDRFAITDKETYKIYGNIFLELLNISKTRKLHSETILGFILEKNKIIIKRVEFEFARVRCNGHVKNGFEFKEISSIK